jgi:hypothetical protein
MAGNRFGVGLQNVMMSPVNPRAVPELEPQVFPIYDHQSCGIAQSQDMNFFRQGFTNARTQRECNIESFPLPNPLVVQITGYSVHIVQPPYPNAVFFVTDISDYYGILYNGVFGFKVGTGGKDYALGNCYGFPSGMGLSGTVSQDGSTAGLVSHVVSNGMSLWSNIHSILGAPITVTPNESFGASIRFPAGALAISHSHTLAVWLRAIVGKQIA